MSLLLIVSVIPSGISECGKHHRAHSTHSLTLTHRTRQYLHIIRIRIECFGAPSFLLKSFRVLAPFKQTITARAHAVLRRHNIWEFLLVSCVFAAGCWLLRPKNIVPIDVLVLVGCHCVYFRLYRVETTAVRQSHSVSFLFFVAEFILSFPTRHVLATVCLLFCVPWVLASAFHTCFFFFFFAYQFPTLFVWLSRRAIPLAAMCQRQ